VLKRELALTVGGFDSGLTTCEEFDFFQRVARTGARFGRVSELLAFYHIRPDSVSQDNLRCLTDARVVIDRGHARDARVKTAAADRAEGRPLVLRDPASYCVVIYFAAREIGAGRDAVHFLEIEDLEAAPSLSPAVVADIIQEILPIAAGQRKNGLCCGTRSTLHSKLSLPNWKRELAHSHWHSLSCSKWKKRHCNGSPVHPRSSWKHVPQRHRIGETVSRCSSALPM
jgi:hypothetical protein